MLQNDQNTSTDNQEATIITGPEAFDCAIQKKLIYAGRKQINYVTGSKIHFHYKTIRCDNGQVIDDSRVHMKPMELVIGKKFKLDAWEKCLKTMWINEVSKFAISKELLFSYPIVAKQMREYYKNLKNNETKSSKCDDAHCSQHTCSFHALSNGLGYDDLNELMKSPQDLDFIFEIVKVEQPDEYKKDSWLLNSDEQLQLIPKLKEEGNQLYNQKEYFKALEKYNEALAYLDQLMTKEKPHDYEWNKLNEVKLKILLNYSQCELCLMDYYKAIEHLNEILKYDKTNIKALYRRSKAYRYVHDYTLAKNDLNSVISLDSGMKNLCINDLRQIDNDIKQSNESQKNLFKGKLFN